TCALPIYKITGIYVAFLTDIKVYLNHIGIAILFLLLLVFTKYRPFEAIFSKAPESSIVVNRSSEKDSICSINGHRFPFPVFCFPRPYVRQCPNLAHPPQKAMPAYLVGS